jgi:hypothetical protein
MFIFAVGVVLLYGARPATSAALSQISVTSSSMWAGGYISSVAYNTNKSLLLLGADVYGLQVSTNDGVNVRPISSGLNSISNDIATLLFNSRNGFAYLCNSAGVFESQDDAKTWRILSDSVSLTNASRFPYQSPTCVGGNTRPTYPILS